MAYRPYVGNSNVPGDGALVERQHCGQHAGREGGRPREPQKSDVIFVSTVGVVAGVDHALLDGNPLGFPVAACMSIRRILENLSISRFRIK